MPQWRNRKTRYVQGVVGVGPWGFESLLRHLEKPGQWSGFCCRMLLHTMGTPPSQASKSPSRARRAWFLVGGLALFLLFGYLVRLAQLQDLRAEIARQQQELQALRRQQASLEEERDLATEPSTIEALARQVLDMIRPGDQIYPIPEESPAQPTETQTEEPQDASEPTPLLSMEWWRNLFGD